MHQQQAVHVPVAPLLCFPHSGQARCVWSKTLELALPAVEPQDTSAMYSGRIKALSRTCHQRCLGSNPGPSYTADALLAGCKTPACMVWVSSLRCVLDAVIGGWWPFTVWDYVQDKGDYHVFLLRYKNATQNWQRWKNSECAVQWLRTSF